ncbi:DUF29 family protein [Anabaena sp. UHCC 0451]|nr:DUF29 family protein [Anabaena sp. UHCC 0451]MEA5578499.1 DUF29 family protein [Anabaena sp. UHCC 0451]
MGLSRNKSLPRVAVKIVSTKTGLSKNLFPPCPYSLEQLLDDDWYPKE